MLVVTLESRFIVLEIVAKGRATLFDLAAVTNQDVPIMVPDLMPEMAEQAAIGLGQFRPALLDLGAIGFRERDRNHAVVVPGHHPGARRGGGSARNSNIRPWTGSSARVFSGSFQRSRL